MNILWWNRILYILCVNSTQGGIMSAQNVSKSGSIIHTALYNLKPRHITIFANSSTRVNKEKSDYLFRGLANKIPAILIDLNHIRISGDNRSLQIPVLQYPRPSTIYVLLLQNEDNEVFDMLNNLITISPIPTRPKCLLIIYSGKDWSELKVRRILRHAWTLKFLDFSIIRIDTNHTAFFNYNPFSKVYSTRYLNTISEIFPDKLNDVNEYPLSFSVFHLPPLWWCCKTNLTTK